MFKSNASRVLSASILPAAKLWQTELTWEDLDAYIFVGNKKLKVTGKTIRNLILNSTILKSSLQ